MPREVAAGGAGRARATQGSGPASAKVFRSVEIRPLQPVNAFEEAIEQILRLIKLGMVVPGEKLLSEREMAARFGVSRPTVREAIRALAQTGYLETRRGRNGGAYVLERPVKPSNRSVRRLVAEMGDDFLDALDFRSVIEPGAAALAAARATPQDHRQLDAALRVLAAAPRVSYPPSERARRDQPADGGHGADGHDADGQGAEGHAPLSYRMADQHFHLLIGEIARSPSVARALAEVQMRISDLIAHTPQVEGALRHSDEQHYLIVDAIVRGDAEAASAAMSTHVAATASYIRGFLA
jgi:DNA-binding FadR family transcriptional regulator